MLYVIELFSASGERLLPIRYVSKSNISAELRMRARIVQFADRPAYGVIYASAEYDRCARGMISPDRMMAELTEAVRGVVRHTPNGRGYSVTVARMGK